MTPQIKLSEYSHNETLWFEVASSSREGVIFDVGVDKDHYWICSCEDYFYRKRFCKHMKQCRDFFMNHLIKSYSSFIPVVESSIVYEEVGV